MMPFSNELAAFQSRTIDPQFDALIVLGTRQATTAALLIGTLNVQHVAFLLTDDTQDLPDQVAVLLGTSPHRWLCPAGDHSTTLTVYQGLRAILDQWSDLVPSSIAVDVTGGLKPMSVGLEKAAHFLGLKTIYIQSKYTQLPDDRFIPDAGTQYLVIPPDPYVIFGDLKAAEAQYHFQNYQYSIAAQLFTELAARMKQTQGLSAELAQQLQTYGRRYTAAASLSAAYAAWDVLDFTTAAQQLKRLLRIKDVQLASLAAYRSTLIQQYNALNRLIIMSAAVVQRHEDALKTLADPESILPLLGTLYEHALRRAAQQRYDVAALFQYRCLELISQHRLATHGILTSAPAFEQLALSKAELSRRFQDVQRAIGRTNIQGLGKKRSLALFDGYMLLTALDDPLVQGYDILRIEQRSAARNQSVLAHGYRLIQKKEYTPFAKVVNELLSRLFVVLGQRRATWRATYRFIAPFMGQS